MAWVNDFADGNDAYEDALDTLVHDNPSCPFEFIDSFITVFVMHFPDATATEIVADVQNTINNQGAELAALQAVPPLVQPLHQEPVWAKQMAEFVMPGAAGPLAIQPALPALQMAAQLPELDEMPTLEYAGPAPEMAPVAPMAMQQDNSLGPLDRLCLLNPGRSFAEVEAAFSIADQQMPWASIGEKCAQADFQLQNPHLYM